MNQGTDKKMRLSLITFVLLGAGIAAFGQQAMPRMTSVDPLNGKIGDVIAVTGENLQKDAVAKVFLTDGKIIPGRSVRTDRDLDQIQDSR